MRGIVCFEDGCEYISDEPRSKDGLHRLAMRLMAEDIVSFGLGNTCPVVAQVAGWEAQSVLTYYLEKARVLC